MAIVTLGCRITGYLRDKALFSVMGAGHLYDMYRTANRIPNLFRGLFAEGTLHAAFVPAISQLVTTKEGRAEARDLLRGLTAVMTLVLGVVVTLGILFSPLLIRLFAEGFTPTPSKIDTTVLMNQIMFPYLLLISGAAILQAVLNSHERFLLSAATPMLFNLTVAGTAWFVVSRYGRIETILSIAVVVGGFFQFFVQYPAVRRLGFKVAPLWKAVWSPGVRQVLILMLPGIPVLGINQINALISNRFASYIDGGVSYTYGAYRVTELVFGLVVVQLTTVLLPLLSQELKASPQTAPRTLTSTATLVSFVTLPAATAMAFASRPMIGALFGGGEFSESDVAITAVTLTAYAFSLVGTGHVKVMASAFFAQKNTKLPMWGSLLTLIVFTVGCWILVDSHGAAGLGWANTISVACFAAFLTLLYSRLYGFSGVSLTATMASVLRQLAGCSVLGTWLYYTRPILLNILTTSLTGFAKLGAVLGAGGILYLAIVYVLGGREIVAVLEAVKGRQER
jgi:putative peptidoglycan lipid II flippase